LFLRTLTHQAPEVGRFSGRVVLDLYGQSDSEHPRGAEFEVTVELEVRGKPQFLAAVCKYEGFWRR
jgi:hypothetical protein